MKPQKRTRIFLDAFLSIVLSLFMMTACSSGSGSMGDGDDEGGESSGSTAGTVPENTDSGKNNNSEPDNINPGDTDSDSGDTDSGDSDSGWTLVFEDNFEGSDSTPNTDYWSLAQKGDDTWNRYMSESYDQAYQKDGYLYLFGMLSDGDEYLTGGIETREKFDFTYGQVKCRARFLRQPQGNHTGIWMMPEPPAEKWPKSGEIDIMEHLDDQKLVYETVHFWDESTGEDSSKDATAEIDNEEFNVYGVVWNKNKVSFTVNGEVKFTYNNDDPDSEDFSYQYPFTKPFYLILSQSLGGKGTWEGVIDDDELPAIFQIDWIKVWQRESQED
ncbi:MAG: glycoside hydrolase family 16 protein [Muribaculaceae bacterium]|nr:glycoside hydrolase family 16 protein [Muribaculaceae bacterium]